MSNLQRKLFNLSSLVLTNSHGLEQYVENMTLVEKTALSIAYMHDISVTENVIKLYLVGL